MPVENSTPNRDYQLPYEFNELKDDVSRVIAALMAIDLDIANVFIALAGKAAGVHSHAITDVTGLAAALEAKLASAERGIANGVASLDASGKVPSTQLPTALFGALAYQGTWNANTNTPTIPAASSSNKGYYFKVSVAGSTSISGINDWKIGDWIVSNGTAWDKVDNTERVQRVAGLEGDISVASLRSALASVVKTGDTMTGPLKLPAGATGDQAIRADEVAHEVLRDFGDYYSTSGGLNIDTDCVAGFKALVSVTGSTGTFPPTPSNFWHIQVENIYSTDLGQRLMMRAVKYMATDPLANDDAPTIYVRYKGETTWGPWTRIVTDRGGEFKSGISFGSNYGASGVDLSKHLALFSTTIGFSVAASDILSSVTTATGAFRWYFGTTLKGTVSSSGHWYFGNHAYIDAYRTGNGAAILGFKTRGAGPFDGASIVATGGEDGVAGSATLSAVCSEFQINGNIVLHSGDLVSQAEAEAGVATEPRVWSAERVAQAIAAQAVSGEAPTAGDNVMLQLIGSNANGTGSSSYDALNGASQINYSKSVVARILRAGTVRVKLEHYAEFKSGDGDGDSYVRVVKNGTQVQQWSTTSSSWQARTIDVPVVAGDIIIVQNRAARNNSYYRNVQICSGTLAFDAVV